MYGFQSLAAIVAAPAHRIGMLGALLALGACGSGAPPNSATTATSSTDAAGDPAANDARFRAAAIASGVITARVACDLLVRADAEAAVGQPLPQTTNNLTLGLCDFNAADFSAGASLTVNSWDSIKAAASSGKTAPVAITGVGDEALNLNGSNGSNLYVRRGDEGFLLTLNGPKIDHLADHGLAQEKGLALKTLSKF